MIWKETTTEPSIQFRSLLFLDVQDQRCLGQVCPVGGSESFLVVACPGKLKRELNFAFRTFRTF